MQFPFFIARRYLFSKKSSNAVNIVTRISLACVSVVTCALVIILSAMNGLSGLVESLYNSFHADIRISPEKGKTFVIDPSKANSIRDLPGVNWYMEVVEENGLVKSGEKQVFVMLRGVENDYAQNTQFDTTVKVGEFNLHPNGQTGVIAGQEIGTKLDLGEMSDLTIYVPKRDRNLMVDLTNMEDEPFNKRMAFCTGLYFVSSDFDGKYVILPIDVVRDLLDYTDESTSVELGLAPGADADATIAAVKGILGTGFKVESRFQQNEILYKTLKSEKMWTFLILIFVLVIATFNTIGSLTLLIIEKKKDIGILWSMGADRKMIRKIFFIEGLLISLAGTVAGILLGLLFCVLQKQFGLIRFGEGFVVSWYPVTVEVMDLVYIVAAVTAIGLLAAWYPVNVFTRKFQHIKIG